MSVRYVLAPEAALDLVQIGTTSKSKAVLRLLIVWNLSSAKELFSWRETPGAGHRNKGLTDVAVKFIPVYSYLIVYRPKTKPLQVVSILHGHRNVEQILKGRL